MGDPSSSPHLTNTTNMKVILMLCVLAVCLPSIKADDAKCKECCFVTTAAPTTAASSTAAPTGSSVKPSSSATTATTAASSKAAYLAEATGTTGTPDKCEGYLTEKDCNEKCGAATFTMSVAFVLASVIMALHV